MGFVLYRSSAGSGKTYTLVKEYLKLVLEDPEKFRHILAITFTNKAAGEMKERILQALKSLSGGEDKALEDTLINEAPGLRHIDKLSAEVLTKLLHNYSDFAIMTIDSFIHRVIKAFALEIGLPLNFTIDLNYEKIQTYVIEKLLSGVGKDGYITEIILEFVFSRVREEKSWNIEPDIRRFEKELFNEKNFEWVNTVRKFDPGKFKSFMHQLKALRESFISRLNALGRQGLDLIDSANLKVDNFAYKQDGAAGYLQKCADLRLGDIKKLEMRARFRNEEWVAKSCENHIKIAVQRLLENGLSHIHREILTHFDTRYGEALTTAFIMDNIYLSAVINQMVLLVDEYKKNNNVIPISDFNLKVNEIVRESPVPFIYSILGEKYNHYLLDEFQDTSRLQWENLFPLIDNALGSDFLNMAVGDGKQSIYRWRGGDVEIMETEIKERIFQEQLSIRPLGKNFRSRENIVAFNNRFFQEVRESLKEENQLLGGIYSTITQENVYRGGGFVSLRFFDETAVAEEDEDDNPVLEWVHKIITQCRKKNYEYGDIAVLIRENKQGEKVAEYLLNKNIHVVSSESLVLSKIPLILFFINVLSYLRNPSDRIAEAAIIYFLAMNNVENPNNPTSIGKSFMEGAQWNLTQEITELFRYRHSLIRMPVYEVVEALIRLFKLEENLTYESTGYLQAFLDIVAGYTSENSVDISSFLDWWEYNSQEFALTVPETKKAVQIMTIHKAKGLEFPVVIIPFSEWEHKEDKQMWLKPDPLLPTDPLLDMPMPVNKSQRLEDTYFKKEYLEEKEKVQIDNINLLYVAFTRAVDELHIVCRRKEKSKNYLVLKDRAAPFMTPDEIVKDRCTYGTPFMMPAVYIAPAEKSRLIGVDYSEADRLISNAWYTRITIRRKSGEFWRFDPDYRAQRRTWGILLHQILSHIKTLEDVEAAIERACIDGEIEMGERSLLAKRIRDIFEVEEVKNWFDPGYLGNENFDVLTERPILSHDSTLRPDRILVSGSRAVIIDFKTGSTSHFHLKQMHNYKSVIESMGYSQVEAYLFYIESKEIKKI